MSGYSFNFKSELTTAGIADSLMTFFCGEIPVIVCIGTDAAIGDCLGPFVGTKLIDCGVNAFIYGSLKSPVTAKDVLSVKNFIKNAHPMARVLVIDAAVGLDEDVGNIRVLDSGVKPGLGADKDLPVLGDVSIISIVAPKSYANHSFMKLTRVSSVYEFAEVISKGIIAYIDMAQSLPIVKREYEVID